MHNWRLLIFAFVAVFQPIVSFTERNLFDGRHQCCERDQLLRDTRLPSYGESRKSTTDGILIRNNSGRDETRAPFRLVRDDRRFIRVNRETTEPVIRLSRNLRSHDESFRNRLSVTESRMLSRTSREELQDRESSSKSSRLQNEEEFRHGSRLSRYSKRFSRSEERRERTIDSSSGGRVRRKVTMERENLNRRETREVLERARADVTRRELSGDRVSKSRMQSERRINNNDMEKDFSDGLFKSRSMDSRIEHIQRTQLTSRREIREIRQINHRQNSRVDLRQDRKTRNSPDNRVDERNLHTARAYRVQRDLRSLDREDTILSRNTVSRRQDVRGNKNDRTRILRSESRRTISDNEEPTIREERRGTRDSFERVRSRSLQVTKGNQEDLRRIVRSDSRRTIRDNEARNIREDRRDTRDNFERVCSRSLQDTRGNQDGLTRLVRSESRRTIRDNEARIIREEKRDTRDNFVRVRSRSLQDTRGNQDDLTRIVKSKSPRTIRVNEAQNVREERRDTRDNFVRVRSRSLQDSRGNQDDLTRLVRSESRRSIRDNEGRNIREERRAAKDNFERVHYLREHSRVNRAIRNGDDSIEFRDKDLYTNSRQRNADKRSQQRDIRTSMDRMQSARRFSNGLERENRRIRSIDRNLERNRNFDTLKEQRFDASNARLLERMQRESRDYRQRHVIRHAKNDRTETSKKDFNDQGRETERQSRRTQVGNNDVVISKFSRGTEFSGTVLSWQYLFYALQAVYLCSMLVQMLNERSSKKINTSSLAWWTTAITPKCTKVD